MRREESVPGAGRGGTSEGGAGASVVVEVGAAPHWGWCRRVTVCVWRRRDHGALPWMSRSSFPGRSRVHPGWGVVAGVSGWLSFETLGLRQGSGQWPLLLLCLREGLVLCRICHRGLGELSVPFSVSSCALSWGTWTSGFQYLVFLRASACAVSAPLMARAGRRADRPSSAFCHRELGLWLGTGEQGAAPWDCRWACVCRGDTEATLQGTVMRCPRRNGRILPSLFGH